MKKIFISDITLREEAANPEFSFTFKEKIELVKELDRLGADVIETAPIENEKTDALLVRTLASLVKSSILSCPVGMTEESVDIAWRAVMNAQSPRLHVILPVSPIQMEYACGKKPEQMIQLIEQLVSLSGSMCDDVEFTADDATRAEPEFLRSAIETAITAGAKTITVADSAGSMMPEELADFIAMLYDEIPAMSCVKLSVQCSDELGMATACAFSAIGAGAEQIKTAVGVSDYPSMEAVAHIFHARGDLMDVRCGLNMTGLNRALRRMTWIATTERGASSAFDNPFGIAAVDDFVLDSNSDISAVADALARQGYDLSDDDMAQVYVEFKRIADKKQVGPKELDAIVAGTALQVPPAYKLVSYVINSGNVITATANIQLEKDGEVIRGLSVGDGPIDASLLAIEQITGCHYELDDFQIQAVTEGREAMGSTLVKLRSNGKVFSGQGVSTDIIGASIRAYIDALNKIVFEEKLS